MEIKKYFTALASPEKTRAMLMDTKSTYDALLFAGFGPGAFAALSLAAKILSNDAASFLWPSIVLTTGSIIAGGVAKIKLGYENTHKPSDLSP